MDPNNQPNHNDKEPSEWLSPIVIITTLLLTSVIALIGITLFGFNKGDILGQLKDGEYARGLITYLFSIGTIGAFVILLLAALTGKGNKEDREDRLKNAKDIFSLLIGIFGSIIGFYFGSIKAETEQGPQPINVAEPVIERADSSNVVLMSHITGGVPPYFYYLKVRTDNPMPLRRTKEWIRKNIHRSIIKSDSVFHITLAVYDAKGDSIIIEKEVQRP